jgi:hypothetical protein
MSLILLWIDQPSIHRKGVQSAVSNNGRSHDDREGLAPGFVRYSIVATSEFVVSRGGPATRVGILATTLLPVSMVRIKTLL